MKESQIRAEFAVLVGTTPNRVRIETIKHAIGGEKKFFTFTSLTDTHIHVGKRIGFNLDQAQENPALALKEATDSFILKGSKIIYFLPTDDSSAKFWCSFEEFQKELDKIENAPIVRVYRTLYREGKAKGEPVYHATMYRSHLMHSRDFQDHEFRGGRHFVYSFTTSKSGSTWQSIKDPRGFKHEAPRPPVVEALVTKAVQTKHIPSPGKVGLRTALEIAMDKYSLAE